MPISGAEAGMRSASEGDQEPERKVREIWWEARVWVKAARISGDFALDILTWRLSLGLRDKEALRG